VGRIAIRNLAGRNTRYQPEYSRVCTCLFIDVFTHLSAYWLIICRGFCVIITVWNVDLPWSVAVVWYTVHLYDRNFKLHHGVCWQLFNRFLAISTQVFGHLDTGFWPSRHRFLAISTQVFLGFPVSISECWDGSQDSKLPLHASHVALPTKFSSSQISCCLYVK
jgi:hypothetical protein